MKNELQKRILSSIILLPILILIIIKGSFFFTTLLVLSFFISSYEWHKMSKNKNYQILGFVFLIWSFYTMYEIRFDKNLTTNKFFIIFLICVLTDVGGYIFGKTFKGPKLISYSPNKTYSGLIGSYLLSLTLVPFLLYFNTIQKDQLLAITALIVLVSSASQAGDIIISYFKRKSNIKDTGKLIPGHGGILDRIDGMLFAFPFANLILINNLFDNI